MCNSAALNDTVQGFNYYATHDQKGDVSNFINQLPPEAEINLIGHSWGGDSAADIAVANPGRIKNLITIDPVSRAPKDPTKIRASAHNWINVNAIEGISFGDTLAALGGTWSTSPKEFAHTYIEAPFKHAEFNILVPRNNPNNLRLHLST